MKTQREKYAESFADYVVEGMRRTGLKQAQVAARANISRQTISQIANKRPHTLTGKLMLPNREIVDAIGRAFGDPISKAREAAGYLTEKDEDQTKESADVTERAAQAERMGELVKDFGLLSPKEQQQILAIIKVLKSDHPELLRAPIELTDAKDLTDDDAEIVTDDTPP